MNTRNGTAKMSVNHKAASQQAAWRADFTAAWFLSRFRYRGQKFVIADHHPQSMPLGVMDAGSNPARHEIHDRPNWLWISCYVFYSNQALFSRERACFL
jgi:hypothetical protein